MKEKKNGCTKRQSKRTEAERLRTQRRKAKRHAAHEARVKEARAKSPLSHKEKRVVRRGVTTTPKGREWTATELDTAVHDAVELRRITVLNAPKREVLDLIS